jgi:hypothetical protein
MAVLIKGKSITCSQKSRDHYLRGQENEKIIVREVWGFATKNPDEALEMIELSAKGTRCKKPLYSVKINPETDRLWKKEEVLRAIALLEENLGLKDHPRVVIEHKKHGRVHYHVLWSRYHPDGGPAKNMGNDYAIHQKTQRQIEKEFKLRPMMARGRDFRQWEVEWAKRYGFDIFALRKEITADFNKAKSGLEFMAALQAHGGVLCRGDKSQFVLILPWGQHKALSSMIYGRPRKAALRRAFSDIDITRLPTVADGKAQVKAALPKIKRKTHRRAHIYIRRSPSQTVSVTKPFTQPQTETSIHSPMIKAIVRTATPEQEQQHVQQHVPIRPDDKKGWPHAAIIDWETWGHEFPAQFFAKWKECVAPGFMLRGFFF